MFSAVMTALCEKRKAVVILSEHSESKDPFPQKENGFLEPPAAPWE